MGLTIAENLKVGPYPEALLINAVRGHQRLGITPLDKPGPGRRDQFLLFAEQRTLGGSVTFATGLDRAAAIVRWLDEGPGDRRFTQVLTLDSEGPYRDLLTLVRHSEFEMTVAFEHWTSGMVRKHREILLESEKPIMAFREWLWKFWSEGLSDVLRRRPDESAAQFAERRRAATVR